MRSAVPLLDVLGHREVDQASDQARWNAAAQEVLERQIEDDRAREADAEWEASVRLREQALAHAKSILGDFE